MVPIFQQFFLLVLPVLPVNFSFILNESAVALASVKSVIAI